jgi:uncharacterized protein
VIFTSWRATKAWRISQLCFAVLLLLASFGFVMPPQALAQVPVPALTGRIVDQTSTLTSAQQAQLDNTLAEFERNKGSQIAVLIVPTTEPEAIEQFSIRVAEQWKLGRKKIDDGVILIVAKNDRTLRIEVGYGLEGVLNDATSKRIISDTIVPYFKSGDFNAGITAGVDQMMKLINGEALPPPTKQSSANNQDSFATIAIVALVVGLIARAVLGAVVGGVVTGAIVGVVVWAMLGTLVLAGIAALLSTFLTIAGVQSTLLSTFGRGGSGGSNSGGGFSGGGFSGGGGGFGGGGASGRW